MKTIVITVSPKGETQVETKGYTGSGCREASKFIESALGITTEDSLKPKFYIQSGSRNSVENSN